MLHSSFNFVLSKCGSVKCVLLFEISIEKRGMGFRFGIEIGDGMVSLKGKRKKENEKDLMIELEVIGFFSLNDIS